MRLAVDTGSHLRPQFAPMPPRNRQFELVWTVRFDDWMLARLLVLLAIPLRLYYFAGFGAIVDDISDRHVAVRVLAEGGLNPDTAHHYRILTVLPRAFAIWLFGLNEYSFILPIFLCAIATHLLAVYAAKDILGSRGALLTSLLFFSTPFETLCATANMNDYINGFFAFGAAWCAYRGYYQNSPAAMRLSAVLAAAGLLNKVSGAGVYAIILFAGIFAGARRRRWAPFWAITLCCLATICLADYVYSGHFTRWFFFNNFFQGHDVTHRLGEIFGAFPGYILFRDDFGHFMFGLSGWLALGGILLALRRCLRRNPDPIAVFVVLSGLVFFLLLNFMPHRFSLEGYYSHFRIYRYLTMYAPALYFAAAYLLTDLYSRPGTARFASVLTAALLLVNLYYTPIVSKPSWDGNRDSREFLAFIKQQRPGSVRAVYAPEPVCTTLSAFYPPEVYGFDLHCVKSFDRSKKKEQLHGAADGFFVTGGAQTPWYGNWDMNVNLRDLDFTVPVDWELVLEGSGRPEQWRRERMRVWRIGSQTARCGAFPRS